MVPVTVCADPAVAEILVAQGAAVVFYGADAEWVARVLAAPRPPGARVAVMIGDPADPAVEAAARALAAEQFGGDAGRGPNAVTRPSAGAGIRYR